MLYTLTFRLWFLARVPTKIRNSALVQNHGSRGQKHLHCTLSLPGRFLPQRAIGGLEIRGHRRHFSNSAWYLHWCWTPSHEVMPLLFGTHKESHGFRQGHSLTLPTWEGPADFYQCRYLLPRTRMFPWPWTWKLTVELQSGNVLFLFFCVLQYLPWHEEVVLSSPLCSSSQVPDFI